jgi:EAL domain-containing protein (putative c-di-GMP-specific phosphodiesterase class I)
MNFSLHAADRLLSQLLEKSLQSSTVSTFFKSDGHIVARYYYCQLTSVFQPLYNLETRRLFGHEAFVRIHTEQPPALSPWKLFSDAGTGHQSVALDRLCRTLHVLNFLNQNNPGGELFLNVHARLLEAVSTDHGAAFSRVLRTLGLEARDVVIELPPMLQEDRVLALHVCANYRFNGFRVALNVRNDANATELIRATMPDFIKAEADELLTSSTNLIDISNLLGIPLIATRLEDAHLAKSLRAKGIQYAQGCGLGMPSDELAYAEPVKLSA